MMRNKVIFFVGFFLATATLASAAGVVPCDGPGCRACDVVILGQNLLMWFIGIMASIIALMFAWGGMQMVMSAGNPGAVTQGREKMTNAVIGLVIILGAWLIVDTVLKVVMGGNIGVWNEVECVANPSRTATPPPSAVVGGGGGGGAGNSSSISSAANQANGMSTANAPGTDGGRKACAWAVNQVLDNAGIAPIDGNSVASMEQGLQNGRGTRIDQSSAGPGDLVIVGDSGGGHVGICQNAGCTSVLSNSTTNRSFSWVSGPDFAPSYKQGVGRIYRVN